MALSTRLNHLPPLTPLTSADTMRSVQIEASVHHRSRRRASVPCVAGTAGTLLPRFGHRTSNSLPPFPRGGFATRPFAAPGGIGTTKALTPAALTQATGLSAYAVLPSRHSAPNHAIRPMAAFPVVSAPSAIPGFAVIQQARHGVTPKRVRPPADWQFASGCSPPRLTATQLPSASKPRHTSTGTRTLLTRRPHGRTGCPGRARARGFWSKFGAKRSHEWLLNFPRTALRWSLFRLGRRRRSATIRAQRRQ